MVFGNDDESWQEEQYRLRREEWKRISEERRHLPIERKRYSEEVQITGNARVKTIPGLVAISELVVIGILIFGTCLNIYNYINKKNSKTEEYRLVNSLNENNIRTRLKNELIIVQSRMDNLKLIRSDKKLIDSKISNTEKLLSNASSSVNNEECIKKFKRTMEDIIDIYRVEKSEKLKQNAKF